jgi:hypothetical protein
MEYAAHIYYGGSRLQRQRGERGGKGKGKGGISPHGERLGTKCFTNKKALFEI